jgi:hypothetical protein
MVQEKKENIGTNELYNEHNQAPASAEKCLLTGLLRVCSGL